MDTTTCCVRTQAYRTTHGGRTAKINSNVLPASVFHPQGWRRPLAAPWETSTACPYLDGKPRSGRIRIYSVHDKDTADRFDDLHIADLRQRGNAKWSYFGDDVLPAWVAEMDFPVARVIREALLDAVEYSRTGYAPKPLDTGLPQACTSWLSRRFGLMVEPGQVRLLPNVLRGVELAIDVFSPLPVAWCS